MAIATDYGADDVDLFLFDVTDIDNVVIEFSVSEEHNGAVVDQDINMAIAYEPILRPEGTSDDPVFDPFEHRYQLCSWSFPPTPSIRSRRSSVGDVNNIAAGAVGPGEFKREGGFGRFRVEKSE